MYLPNIILERLIILKKKVSETRTRMKFTEVGTPWVMGTMLFIFCILILWYLGPCWSSKVSQFLGGKQLACECAFHMQLNHSRVYTSNTSFIILSQSGSLSICSNHPWPDSRQLGITLMPKSLLILFKLPQLQSYPDSLLLSWKP